MPAWGSPTDPSRLGDWRAAEHAAAQHAAAAAAAAYSGVVPSQHAGLAFSNQLTLGSSPDSISAAASAQTEPNSGGRAAEQIGGIPYSEVLLSPDTTPPGSAQRAGAGGGMPSDGGGRWRSPLSTPTPAAAAMSVSAPEPSDPASYPAALQQRQWWTPHQAAAGAALRGSSTAGFELPFSLITSSPALLPTGQAQQAQQAGPSIESLQARHIQSLGIPRQFLSLSPQQTWLSWTHPPEHVLVQHRRTVPSVLFHCVRRKWPCVRSNVRNNRCRTPSYERSEPGLPGATLPRRLRQLGALQRHRSWTRPVSGASAQTWSGTTPASPPAGA